MGKLTKEILAGTQNVPLSEPYEETYLVVQRLEVGEYSRLKAEAQELIANLISPATDENENGDLGVTVKTVADGFERAAEFARDILKKTVVDVGGTDLTKDELLQELERETELLIGMAWQALGVNNLTDGSKKNLLGLLGSLLDRRDERKQNEESAIKNIKDLPSAKTIPTNTIADIAEKPDSALSENAATPTGSNTEPKSGQVPENTTTV